MFGGTIMYLFIVTLQPEAGVGGGPQHVEVTAHDANSARRLAQAQYRGYRVSNVAQKQRIN